MYFRCFAFNSTAERSGEPDKASAQNDLDHHAPRRIPRNPQRLHSRSQRTCPWRRCGRTAAGLCSPSRVARSQTDHRRVPQGMRQRRAKWSWSNLVHDGGARRKNTAMPRPPKPRQIRNPATELMTRAEQQHARSPGLLRRPPTKTLPRRLDCRRRVNDTWVATRFRV